MRAFRILLRHELATLLLNTATYVAAVLFLLVMGFLFHAVVDNYATQPREEPPSVALFSVFWLPAFFLVPLLTMRTLAEERRSGTLETLLAAPVPVPAVIVAKFAASYLLYLGLWTITLAYPWILRAVAGPAATLEWGPLLGGYLFVAASGLLFVALGILASSLCHTQLVAGIATFTLLFAIVVGTRYLGEWIDRLPLASPLLRAAIEQVQVFDHAASFSRGLLDSRPLVLYASGTAVALLAGVVAVEQRGLRR